MQLFERLEDELAALPGVTAVSDSAVALLNGDTWGSNVSVQGFTAGPDTDTVSLRNELGPGYFMTLGIPLITGREFTRADTAGAPKVAVVNQAFAAKFNLGNDAVGKWMATGRSKLDTEIVGLVKNAKYDDVKAEIMPQFFQPYRQDPANREMTFYIRTSLDPEQFLGAIQRIVARLDPNLPVVGLRPMPEQVRENVFLDRFITVLSTAFACLATLLAAVGLYGVLAYTVAQRTREIGLRMALGAPPSRVRKMVLRQVGIMTLCGAAIGLTAAVWLGRLAQSLLYQLQGWDPAVLACATLALAAVALGAGFIPAHRASKVEPMRALRCE
jgi:predicted permease